MSMENEAAAQALALDRSVSDAEINIAISHAKNAIEAAGETQSPACAARCRSRTRSKARCGCAAGP